MKEKAGHEKCIIYKVIFCSIIILIASVNFYTISLAGKSDGEYYTTATIDDITTLEEVECVKIIQEFCTDAERLNTLEFIFNQVAEDKKGSIILQIMAEETLVYQTNVSLANINNNEWKKYM